MSEEIDQKLRAALRPIDPEDGFADRVMAKVAGARSQDAGPGRSAWLSRSSALVRAKTAPLPRLAAALAASLMVGVFALHQWQEHRREQQGLEARRQLIEALRVTGEKLDIAYEIVNHEAGSS